MEYKFLITASGTGSRLGKLTKFLNKAIVRVGEQAAISYIIDRVPQTVPIVITVGYLGNLVRDYVMLAHPERQIEFVEVSNYEGPGSSLGASLMAAAEFLQCPFIYSACDTLVFSEISPPSENWVGLSAGNNSVEYSTAIVAQDRLVRINNKGEKDFDYVHIGLVGVKDYSSFWSRLCSLLVSAPLDSSLNDCAVINRMLEDNVAFTVRYYNDWMDIGNINALEQAREKIFDSFDNLEKENEAIYLRSPNHVIKFFADSRICVNRLKRASVLNTCVPKITGVSKNFYRYEYAEGELLSRVANEELTDRFLSWCVVNLWKPVQLTQPSLVDFHSRCMTFYKDKTFDRVKLFQTPLRLIDQEEYINGHLTPPLFSLLSEVDWVWLSSGTATGFHGDLHFENILVSPDAEKGFVLVDWRQDFAGIIDFGDVYYDLAKLQHGLVVSHDMVRNNMFKINIQESAVSVGILREDRLVCCEHVFRDVVSRLGFDLLKVDILTALIYLNIAALHHHPYSQFLYYFGRYKLSHALHSHRKRLPFLKDARAESHQMESPGIPKSGKN